jgi:predicted  nucleic acid-binding Zn-ribbon protein
MHRDRSLIFLSPQLSSQKQLLEIELNDDLRRRREDLKTALESNSDEGGAADTDATEVEALKERLVNLEQSIDELQGSIEGKPDLHWSQGSSLIRSSINSDRGRIRGRQ